MFNCSDVYSIEKTQFKLSRQKVKDIFNPKIGYDFGGREEKYTELD